MASKEKDLCKRIESLTSDPVILKKKCFISVGCKSQIKSKARETTCITYDLTLIIFAPSKCNKLYLKLERISKRQSLMTSI